MPTPAEPTLTDELTGLSNERHFRIIIEYACAVADRGMPLSLGLVEIDGWERFRGERGREEATAALRRFARILAGTTRRTDVTARLGGSRCATLLLDCNVQGALIFGERIQTLSRPLSDQWGLTVSVGVAAFSEGARGPDELRASAERALGIAREEGGTVHFRRDGDTSG